MKSIVIFKCIVVKEGVKKVCGGWIAPVICLHEKYLYEERNEGRTALFEVYCGL